MTVEGIKSKSKITLVRFTLRNYGKVVYTLHYFQYV